MSSTHSIFLVAFTFSAGLFVPSCGTSDTGETCSPGTEGCPCTEEAGCDDGLSCISDVCVAPPEATCGDGILQTGEECDNGALNGDDAACKANCTIAFCGDGLVGPGEACDDGNDSDLDGCNAMCRFPTCGNGVVEGAEPCDDGNDDDTDACTNLCLPASCGDGFVQAGEACDDGNTMDGDGCSAACEIEAICGNGVVMPGETCFSRGPLVIADPLPVGVAVGDFDGDGFDDIATASEILGTVRVLRGNGMGGFLAAVPVVASSAPPVAIEAGDIDGDGFDDVAVGLATDMNAVAIFYGQGIPGDPPLPDTPVFESLSGSSVLTDLRLRQLDGDGGVEIVVAFDGGLRVLQYDGNGGFSTDEINLGANLDLTVEAIDLTGDGIREFLTLDRATGDVFSLGYFTATNSFNQATLGTTAYPSLLSVRRIVAAPLDNEAPEDLVAGVWDTAGCDYPSDPDACASESIAFLAGRAAYPIDPQTEPPLEDPVLLPGGKAPAFVLPVDADGDGDMDLVVANRFSNDLSILVSDGAGAFSAGPTLPTAGFEPVAVATGDFNEDGLVDLVSADRYTNSLSVFLNTP